MMLIPARESCAAEDELRADVEQVACPVVLIDRLVQNGWCSESLKGCGRSSAPTG